MLTPDQKDVTMPSSNDHAPLLSVEEAATLLGQSRSSLYRSIHKGDLPLPLIRMSGRWRIPRRSVERLINGETGKSDVSPTGVES